METTIKPLEGQSNIDICLKSLGGLNGFIRLLSSNGVIATSSTVKSYSFNTNNIENRIFSGRDYSTSKKYTPLLNNDGFILLNNDGNALFNNF